MMAADREAKTSVSIDFRRRTNSPANDVSNYVGAGRESLRIASKYGSAWETQSTKDWRRTTADAAKTWPIVDVVNERQ